MRGKCCVRILRKIFWMEAEMLLKRCCVFHVKCRKLLTDRNQTCSVCISCIQSKKYTCMGKFLQWKPTFSRKGTLYSRYSTRHSCPIASNFHRLSRMRGKCGVWIFTKITALKSEIQSKRHFVLGVKCPLLVTDGNQTYIISSACVERARCEFSGKLLQLKPKSNRESTLLFNWRSINYWRIGSKPFSLGAHAWEVGSMNFQAVLLNGSRETFDKVLCTPSKVPLIINRSQLNLLHSYRMHEKCEVLIFRKVPPIKAEIRPKRHAAVHVTCL